MNGRKHFPLLNIRQGSMLERETELIKQIIIESTINGRSAVKVNEIIAAGVPRGVKAFVVAQVDLPEKFDCI